MKLNTWHSTIRQWLASLVDVHNWYLSEPVEYYSPTGFIPPVRNVYLDDTDFGFSQDMFLMVRIPSNIPYDNIDMDYYQGLYANILSRLSRDYASLAEDVNFFIVENVAQPITIQETGDKIGDWLIELHWQFRVGSQTLEETALDGDDYTGEPLPDQPVRIRRLAIWRSRTLIEESVPDTIRIYSDD